MGDLTKIKGIGSVIEKYFNNLDIYDIKDLLYYFPRDYESYEEPIKVIELEVGKVSTIKALVVNNPSTFKKGRVTITWCMLDDGSGRIRAYWFNIPFINKTLVAGKSYIFRGKVSEVKNGTAISQCKIYSETTYNSFKGSLSPVYSLTKGLSNNTIKKTIKNLLVDKEVCGEVCKEYLPKDIIAERNLCSLSYAINHMHYPTNIDDMLKARKRLVYDEFFLFSLAMQTNKNKNKKVGRTDFKEINEKLLNDIVIKLPYKLTKSQVTAIKDIIKDFKSKKMNRLLEGDVGSGKTIVAILTAYLVSKIGVETAFMAPTEVLAEQHFENILKFDFAKKYEKIDESFKKEEGKVYVALLTGSTKVKDRKAIIEGIKEGVIDIIIGTHALFSKDVEYKDLGYIIIDEQHKFGVGQRKALEDKSNNANVLIMSATPIPRTLSMLYYADMDISRLVDKPANRLPIKNYVAKINEREKSFNSMKKQIEMGHQAYVICASIEKEDEENVGSFANYQNVYDYAERLHKYYGNGIKIGILHGKMKNDEKYDVMQKFKNNEINILVSTTVVEVGVDVPNATYLMVEDAGSFGLAELHQLRGRVGRGTEQSYALFVDTTETDISKVRLKILAESNDGFYIAEEDLRLRGPGDVFGVRQSGEMEFRLADMYTDIGVFREAAVDAKVFIEKGFTITSNISERLKKYLSMGYVI
ncbi:MAG: ATP-dependent DNA helicase RecG [Lachnospiraceae bacterium]|nr:ATP-dependent DNA helicase RecG [Lachnospiraceae bacterium]